MATTQQLITILILFLSGCEQPAATVPQTSSAASVAPQTTAQAIEPITTLDTASEAAEQANEITGKVVGIIDGDTIDLLTADKTTIKIRLNGIDAPETGQPFGKNAKQYLSGFIGGQVVRVVTHGQDRYGRTIGDVFFNSTDGADIPPGATLPDWEMNRGVGSERAGVALQKVFHRYQPGDG